MIGEHLAAYFASAGSRDKTRERDRTVLRHSAHIRTCFDITHTRSETAKHSHDIVYTCDKHTRSLRRLRAFRFPSTTNAVSRSFARIELFVYSYLYTHIHTLIFFKFIPTSPAELGNYKYTNLDAALPPPTLSSECVFLECTPHQ